MFIELTNFFSLAAVDFIAILRSDDKVYHLETPKTQVTKKKENKEEENKSKKTRSSSRTTWLLSVQIIPKKKSFG